MQPIGPSLVPAPSSHTMMTKPLLVNAAELVIAGTVLASHVSPVAILFVLAQPPLPCMSLHKFGTTQFRRATALFCKSPANCEYGRTYEMHVAEFALFVLVTSWK